MTNLYGKRGLDLWPSNNTVSYPCCREPVQELCGLPLFESWATMLTLSSAMTWPRDLDLWPSAMSVPSIWYCLWTTFPPKTVSEDCVANSLWNVAQDLSVLDVVHAWHRQTDAPLLCYVYNTQCASCIWRLCLSNMAVGVVQGRWPAGRLGMKQRMGRPAFSKLGTDSNHIAFIARLWWWNLNANHLSRVVYTKL